MALVRYKSTFISSLVMMMMLVLSGCSKIDQELLLSCESLKKNLDRVYSDKEKFERMHNANMNRANSANQANWNKEARREMIDFVNVNFSFLAPYFSAEKVELFTYSENNSGRQIEDRFKNLSEIMLLQEVLKGTGFSLEISNAQIEAIKNETDATRLGNATLIKQELNRIMGDFSADEMGEFKGTLGCSTITEDRYYKKKDSRPSGNFGEDLYTFLMREDPRKVFEEIFIVGMFNMAGGLFGCEIKGEVVGYQAKGDGTPGKNVTVKCRD